MNRDIFLIFFTYNRIMKAISLALVSILIAFLIPFQLLFCQNQKRVCGGYYSASGKSIHLKEDGFFRVPPTDIMGYGPPVLGTWAIKDSLIFLSGTRNFDKLPLCVLESVDTTLT
jgi:hypothetical protein